MDSTMNSLSTQAILGAVTVALAVFVAATFGGSPLAVGFVATAAVAGLACVASAAQSRRLGDEERLVYRPVYVRRHDAQRRVRSDD